MTRDAIRLGLFRFGAVMRVDARDSAQVDFLVKTLLSYRYAETLGAPG